MQQARQLLRGTLLRVHIETEGQVRTPGQTYPQ
jgi:hypothetical protein